MSRCRCARRANASGKNEHNKSYMVAALVTGNDEPWDETGSSIYGDSLDGHQDELLWRCHDTDLVLTE